MQQGYGITEILVGMAIAGVLALTATPMIMHTAERAQFRAQAHAVADLLEYARRTALTGQAPVLVCSGSPAGCDQEWDSAQLVVFDDVNHSETLDAGDSLVQVSALKKVRTVWRGFRLGVPIGFEPQRGTARNSGSLYLCPLHDSPAQRILVNNAGRVRSEPCENCTACAL